SRPACRRRRALPSSSLRLVVFLVALLVRVDVTGVLRTRRSRGDLGIGLFGPCDEVLDLTSLLGHRVQEELDRGRVPQAELLADLGSDQTGGARERRGRTLPLALVTHHGVEHRGMLT